MFPGLNRGLAISYCFDAFSFLLLFFFCVLLTIQCRYCIFGVWDLDYVHALFSCLYICNFVWEADC